MSKDQSKKNLSRVNVKKKVWYKIIGPKMFGQMELGETYLSSPEEAVGRTVKINLKDITGNVKDQNAYVCFKLDAVEGTALKASAVGYELTATHVKKLVRKNTDRIDDYFAFTTKEGKKIIIKTLIITQSKAQRSVRGQLRKKLSDYLAEEAKNSTFDVLIENLATRKIQMTLKKSLYKIYPINEVAVRVLTLNKSPSAVEGERNPTEVTPDASADEVLEAQAPAE
ncbi:MAG: hypothetical protein AABW53_01730 [Nanoarchaeota archaeon]